MREIKDIFNLPALFLHELSHVIVAYILMGKLDNIIIKRHNLGHIIVLLNIIGLTNNQAKIVAMSPFLIPLTFFLLSFVSPWFFLYFPYAILNYKTTLPSNTDWSILNL